MTWLDDLEARAEQTVGDKASTDINSYIDNSLTDDLTKVGQAALGNLTAAQLANGQKGATKPIAPPQGGFFNTANSSKMILVIVAIVVAVVVLKKRRRG